jgi:cytochrome c-type biogenesis protein CcmF
MRSTGEGAPLALFHLVARARPRYGGYLVHLGMAFIAVGVISSSFFQFAREVTLPVDQSFTIGRYTLTNLGLSETRGAGSRTVGARLALSEDGGPPHYVEPAKVFYDNFGDQAATHVVIETRRLEDLYLVLTGWADNGTISLLATLNPMVPLIWVGGVILIIGALVSMWPEPVVAPRRVVAAPIPRAIPSEA